MAALRASPTILQGRLCSTTRLCIQMGDPTACPTASKGFPAGYHAYRSAMASANAVAPVPSTATASGHVRTRPPPTDN